MLSARGRINVFIFRSLCFYFPSWLRGGSQVPRSEGGASHTNAVPSKLSRRPIVRWASCRKDIGPVLGKRGDDRPVEVESLGNHVDRAAREPIRQQHLLKTVGAEHFHVDEIRIASVYEVMAIRLLDQAYVAGVKV